jgi:hypothetical protein
MFKYISDILNQFNSSQKITALLIVLISIISITVGPTLIDAAFTDCEELSVKVKNLRDDLEYEKKESRKLRDYTDTLNKRIRISAIECTDEIVRREKELLWQIERIERRVVNQEKVIIMDTITQLDYVNGKPAVTVTMRNDELVEDVKRLKNNLSRDIDNLDNN